ncbi:hypothetical protein DPEC_G00339800 [Dallia pectoralis]|uniref:Uncharacterized protein n=1 Tax=Dallia pectoralis TaxID=75939 RepID=A0ACC2F4Z4_DALPE|nr:hypothetical protein DPEC_G00339800 [Dallia pectoralis]
MATPGGHFMVKKKTIIFNFTPTGKVSLPSPGRLGVEALGSAGSGCLSTLPSFFLSFLLSLSTCGSGTGIRNEGSDTARKHSRSDRSPACVSPRGLFHCGPDEAEWIQVCP